MEVKGFTPQAEQRRRLYTTLLLAGGMLTSTIFVSNERALFNPLDDLSGDDALAYAVTMRTGFGNGGPPGTRRWRTPGQPGEPAGNVPNDPTAFAFPVPPPDAPGAGITPQTPGGVTPQGFTPPGSLDPNTPGLSGGTPPQGGGGGSPTFPGAPGLPGTIGQPVGAVPETSTWAMMIIGLGSIGGLLRRRQRRALEEQREALNAS